MNLMNNSAEFMSRGTLIKLRKAKNSQNMSQIMYGYVFFRFSLSFFLFPWNSMTPRCSTCKIQSTYSWYNLKRLSQQIVVTDFKKKCVQIIWKSFLNWKDTFSMEFDIILSAKGRQFLADFQHKKICAVFRLLSLSFYRMSLNVWRNLKLCMCVEETKHSLSTVFETFQLNPYQIQWNLIWRITFFRLPNGKVPKDNF